MSTRIPSNSDDKNKDVYVKPKLRRRVKKAISTDNLDKLKHLIKILPENWWRMKVDPGHALLHEAIFQNSKKIFHYILPFHDLEDLETKNCFKMTALKFCMTTSHEYYAYELINQGASIDGLYTNGQNLLHRAVSVSVTMTKRLLDRGIAVNVQDKNGYTPLRKVVINGLDRQDPEYVPMLSSCGAKQFV
ncbi:hypothetical protein Zmor_019168 [Zophobas morio]|uniref:Uncharacterized protein n=1 Tax=Zophobas morio TaxID=2755281 RepID=A0AA38I1F5_9CUCU|nr:hypothetical protein Zmor_019168 [Zophobas morio]